MSSPASGGSEFFDVDKIRRLAELMKDQDLSEVEMQEGQIRLRLRRKLETTITTVEARPAPAAPSAPQVSKSAPAATAAAVEENVEIIKSPMVGTFYVSSSPESPPFVKVGDHVGPSTTVCIIEAMKVFNEIPAETSGKIVAVLVENGEPVEFGHPLFKVQRQ
jgi:acetyl-CoA carboxylase biotin carboxyl carrier protein